RFIVNEKSFKTTVPDITFICSIVAHDLINPYNIILGYTKILKDNYSTLSDANRINYIDKVHSYAKANFNLVNGLLKWAKLQSRGISIKNEVLNANDYLRKIVKPYLPLLDEKKINLVIDGKENEVFYADNKFFNIIIVNLFINAIKFSRKNGTITLQLKKEGNFTHIIVQDNGVGMSEEKLKEIFKLSCITSEIGTEGEQGTGMGLYICKKLIAYKKYFHI
ncbi:sensor histidine kinase, partial [Polaribacter sp.]|uniref:sensor histidine kinase n=1 Tax=Polaribacter sp. TaxID=1920175 RepID=UPI003F6B9D0A